MSTENRAQYILYSGKILKKIRPDDIILLHDARPKKEDLLGDWLKEVEQVLTGLEAKKLKVLPLSEIIARPVMSAQTREKFGLDSVKQPGIDGQVH